MMTVEKQSAHCKHLFICYAGTLKDKKLTWLQVMLWDASHWCAEKVCLWRNTHIINWRVGSSSNSPPQTHHCIAAQLQRGPCCHGDVAFTADSAKDSHTHHYWKLIRFIFYFFTKACKMKMLVNAIWHFLWPQNLYSYFFCDGRW